MKLFTRTKFIVGAIFILLFQGCTAPVPEVVISKTDIQSAVKLADLDLPVQIDQFGQAMPKGAKERYGDRMQMVQEDIFAVSADNKWCATGMVPRELYIYDLPDSKTVKVFPMPKDYIGGRIEYLEFMPDNKTLVVATEYRVTFISIHPMEVKFSIAHTPNKYSTVNVKSVLVTDDLAWMAVCASNGGIINLKTKKWVHHDISFFAKIENNLYLTGGAEYVATFNSKSGQLKKISTKGWHGIIRKGPNVVVNGNNVFVLQYKGKAEQALVRYQWPNISKGRTLPFKDIRGLISHPTRPIIFLQEHPMLENWQPNEIHVYDVKNSKVIKTIRCPGRLVRLCHDGKYLVYRSGEHLKILDWEADTFFYPQPADKFEAPYAFLNTGELLSPKHKVLKGFRRMSREGYALDSIFTRCSVSTSSNTITVVGHEKWGVWDGAGKQRFFIPKHNKTPGVYNSINSSGTEIASYWSKDQKLRILSLENGSLKKQVTISDESLDIIGAFPNGTWAGQTNDGIYSVDSDGGMDRVIAFKEKDQSKYDVSMNSSGDNVIVRLYNKTTYILRANDLSIKFEIQDGFTSCDISPDGHYLIGKRYLGSFAIYDLQRRKAVLDFGKLVNGYSCGLISFTPDAKEIYVLENNGLGENAIVFDWGLIKGQLRRRGGGGAR